VDLALDLGLWSLVLSLTPAALLTLLSVVHTYTVFQHPSADGSTVGTSLVRSYTSGVRGVRTPCQENTYIASTLFTRVRWGLLNMIAITVLTVYHCSFSRSGGMICHDVF